MNEKGNSLRELRSSKGQKIFFQNFQKNLVIRNGLCLTSLNYFPETSMEAVAPDTVFESISYCDDSFAVIPRNCDTAVVYWNLTSERHPVHSSVRLCLQVNGEQSDAEETIFLHREAGHFIVPLLAEDREYRISLGWNDTHGFRAIFEQTIRLPEHPSGAPGAMSSSLSYRGAHFWPKGGASVN
jgi:hypothetical protein